MKVSKAKTNVIIDLWFLYSDEKVIKALEQYDALALEVREDTRTRRVGYVSKKSIIPAIERIARLKDKDEFDRFRSDCQRIAALAKTK